MQVDTNSTGGVQNNLRILGLSNGNILVVYTDDSGTVGSGSGSDIIAALYDPEGNVLRAPWQLGNIVTAGDQSRPDIAATADGGFYMVYLDEGGANASIRLERFDADGNSSGLEAAAIAVSSATVDVTNPRIAVNPLDGNPFVTWETVGTTTDEIRSYVVDGDTLLTVPGSPVGGHLVTDSANLFTTIPAAHETVAGQGGTHVTLVGKGSDSGLLLRYSNVNTGLPGTLVEIGTTRGDGGGEINPTIAPLAGGEVVVVYYGDAGRGPATIRFEIYSQTGAMLVAVTDVPQTDVVGNAARPDVISLRDGGFSSSGHMHWSAARTWKERDLTRRAH